MNPWPKAAEESRQVRQAPVQLAVTIPYRGSQGPLNLLINIAGIKAEGERRAAAAMLGIFCRVVNTSRQTRNSSP